MDINKLRNIFHTKFGAGGSVYTAPGRINVIGEHTDYNDGFVLPGVIEHGIYCEIKPNPTSKRVRAHAMDFNEDAEFMCDSMVKPAKQWACYIFGMCREIAKKTKNLSGFDVVFGGDVPIGAGISASAAITSCFGFALNDVFNLKLSLLDLALMGQATEHNYIGIKCGIMDQFATLYGKKDTVIRLDCRSLDYKYIPCKLDGFSFVLINTCKERSLAVGGEYNKRRASCEKVVSVIQKTHPNVKSLRDVNYSQLIAARADIDPVDYKRASYVVGEIVRMTITCAALQKGDFETVGKKMYETHEGLSKNYEVSCPELDFLIDQAKACGVTGARVMGGGFGGCTINLVKDSVKDNFIKTATAAYNVKFKKQPQVYNVVLADGARKIC